ncbi:hypothetical protein HRR83_009398 [Exophiala dermatitidis]|uniref:Ribonuclease P protein subunit n=2 Tax=Exophiala dermatitidis TaxID=5970 RepID=H6BLS9_EXODN|nr:ribonuclease P subunit P29 [Exophiala dermatitidis NIH/UT8656]KAJ4502884.1 hypothetical protein HRR73_009312 [Exophiala dermatitidis]EHY52917.1 ribonuclease P subunit P29 [Exophiala dermatitidis NIH/UT8656]KAJ4512274.1 hypothetical protein HRR75_005175 [Exophiala dermatitidis]KAJ4515180.1 hypothetical protein HRR74_005646 [Exophiala dermatitidis]KAJ4536228.1 hypothetical protein HRR78_008577 [Exophiala dermatitidis]
MATPSSPFPRGGGGAGPTNTTTTTTTGTPPSHPAHTLLNRAHSPDTAARIFTDKIKNKPFFLATTSTSASAAPEDKRALRRHIRLRKKEYYLRKRRPRPLSAKEKRELGVYKLDREAVTYETYEGLNRLWNAYMLEVLGLMPKPQMPQQQQQQPQQQQKRQQQSSVKQINPNSHGSLLASADFHGAEVEVVRCADPGRVGTRGIVVRDTKYTFVVVTRVNQVRTLPKRNTVFRYEVRLGDEQRGEDLEQGEEEKEQQQQQPPQQQNQQQQQQKLVFEVHGNQFEFRPAERANRKFKWKAMDYL